MFTAASLFGSIMFSTIGLAALAYGKKAGALNPMLFGIALVAYPYFVPQTWLLYAVGLSLTALLVKFPD
jgi:hypothetical protein